MISLDLKKIVAQHFLDCPGFDYQKFLECLDEPAVASIRFNKIIDADLTQIEINQFINKSIPWCNHGYYLKQKYDYALDPLWHAGVYYVQEASSMFLNYLLEQISMQRQCQDILDLCAAPGGKTQIMATLFPQANIIANETISNRLGILEENIIKCGKKNILITSNTSLHFKSLHSTFDLVLIDAPCSGSGLFRKLPNYLKTWQKSFVNQCALRQEKLIDDIIPTLKIGGYLIYATCSLSLEENEEIVKKIIKKHELKTCYFDVPPSWNIYESSDDSKFLGYRLYPYNLEGEGFFISIMQKQNVSQINNTINFNKPLFEELNNNERQYISQHKIKDGATNYIVKYKDEIVDLQSTSFAFFRKYSSFLNIKMAGLNIGRFKGFDFHPHHHWAMLFPTEINFPKIEISKIEALNYLRKNPLSIDNLDKSWILVKYQQWFLGWIKLAGNRINNYYPSHWRLRK